jgi:hypothetical protein
LTSVLLILSDTIYHFPLVSQGKRPHKKMADDSYGASGKHSLASFRLGLGVGPGKDAGNGSQLPFLQAFLRILAPTTAMNLLPTCIKHYFPPNKGVPALYILFLAVFCRLFLPGREARRDSNALIGATTGRARQDTGSFCAFDDPFFLFHTWAGVPVACRVCFCVPKGAGVSTSSCGGPLLLVYSDIRATLTGGAASICFSSLYLQAELGVGRRRSMSPS